VTTDSGLPSVARPRSGRTPRQSSPSSLFAVSDFEDLFTPFERCQALLGVPLPLRYRVDVRAAANEPAPTPDPAVRILVHQMLRRARLSLRERRILVAIYWRQVPLAEIGLALGISGARVSQLQHGALLKLRRVAARCAS
jgi:DNA-directed RNA polymerase specialized sigma24 family protein